MICFSLFYFLKVPTLPAKIRRVSQDGAVATDILQACVHIHFNVDEMACNDSILNHVSNLQLPDDILQRILVFVVLEDGCSAILRLALACQTFNNIVSQDHFQQEAHFRWLDSELNKCGCPIFFFV